MKDFSIAFAATFFGLFVAVPLFFGLLRLLGGYVIVREREARVYVLFGKVIGIIQEPGFHVLLLKLGPAALLVPWAGKCHVLDLRLDQIYLRSQAVNSEEGAPMGIGIWYEMFISDPVAYLFRNTNPRGSLAANVSSASIRCLSNLKLSEMLENRHSMSRAVRAEASLTSREWGFDLGSVYIRKVHFRDEEMMRQIESKVVNRLRQVTSAIKQEGANQVSVIKSTADREAAIEFAKAAAIRPKIVGEALEEISRDAGVAKVLFDVLEVERLVAAKTEITLVPQGSGQLLSSILATQAEEPLRPPKVPRKEPR